MSQDMDGNIATEMGSCVTGTVEMRPSDAIMNKTGKVLTLRSRIEALMRAEGNMHWPEASRVTTACTDFMEA